MHKLKFNILAITALLILLSACSKESKCKEEYERKINVSGECLKKVVPNRGSIEITVNNLENTVKEATKKTQNTYNELTKIIKDLDFKDVEMETTTYWVNEEREWNKDKKEYVTIGYRAKMGLEISTSEIDRIGEIIAATSELKKTEAGRLNSYVAPQKMKEVREECLAEAMRNAKQKAERMTKAVGASVGDLISANENIVSPPSYRRPPMRTAMMEKSTAPLHVPEIHAKADDLHLKVDVTFEIK
jgi:uncharacterized protein YggE